MSTNRRRKARAYTLKHSPRAHGASGRGFRRLVRAIPRDLLDPLTRGIAWAALDAVLERELGTFDHHPSGIVYRSRRPPASPSTPPPPWATVLPAEAGEAAGASPELPGPVTGAQSWHPRH